MAASADPVDATLVAELAMISYICIFEEMFKYLTERLASSDIPLVDIMDKRKLKCRNCHNTVLILSTNSFLCYYSWTPGVRSIILSPTLRVPKIVLSFSVHFK